MKESWLYCTISAGRCSSLTDSTLDDPSLTVAEETDVVLADTKAINYAVKDDLRNFLGFSYFSK